jgi:hypothetical protein
MRCQHWFEVGEMDAGVICKRCGCGYASVTWLPPGHGDEAAEAEFLTWWHGYQNRVFGATGGRKA